MKSAFAIMIAWLFLVSPMVRGAMPDSRYQYAADGEYDDLCLVVPWVDSTASKLSIEFRYPKCAELQPADRRYADTMLFNGVIKFAGGMLSEGWPL